MTRSPTNSYLRRRLASHNRHVYLGTFIALLAATLLWVILYYAGHWLVLFGLTAAVGEAAQLPRNYDRWFAGYVLVICLSGWGWRLWRRGRPLTDRPIFGWHLLPEIFFLPAELTFSISGNLAAHRRITPDLVEACSLLLEEIQRRQRLDSSKVGQLAVSAALADEALLALQYAGLIDLHRGSEDWFYTVRSSVAPVLKKLSEAERTAMPR